MDTMIEIKPANSVQEGKAIFICWLGNNLHWTTKHFVHVCIVVLWKTIGMQVKKQHLQ